MSMPPAPSQQGKVPILECVREGFAFVARDWRQILPVALIGAIVLSPLEVWSEIAMRTSDLGSAAIASLLAVLVQAPIQAAFYRRALSRGTESLALRLGRDEANLAGVTVSLGFLFLIIFFVAIFVAILSLASLMVGSGVDTESLRNLPPQEAAQRFVAALGADGQLVFLAELFGFALLALWLSARVAVAYPATVAEGRMLMFSTWNWTKGNAAPIAACLVLVLAGALALSVLALAIPSLVTSAIFGERAVLVAGSPGHWIMTFIGAAVSITLLQASMAAMMAYLYRGLRPA